MCSVTRQDSNDVVVIADNDTPLIKHNQDPSCSHKVIFLYFRVRITPSSTCSAGVEQQCYLCGQINKNNSVHFQERKKRNPVQKHLGYNFLRSFQTILNNIELFKRNFDILKLFWTFLNSLNISIHFVPSYLCVFQISLQLSKVLFINYVIHFSPLLPTIILSIL